MLSVLVSCKLEQPYVATEIGEYVISLSVSKADLEIWDTRETPGGPVLGRELGGDPKLENFGLALKLVTIFAMIDGCEARDVYLPAIIVLTNVLGEESTSLCDIKNLVGGLDLGSLLVP